jgi:hypothetical protein
MPPLFSRLYRRQVLYALAVLALLLSVVAAWQFAKWLQVPAQAADQPTGRGRQ